MGPVDCINHSPVRALSNTCHKQPQAVSRECRAGLLLTSRVNLVDHKAGEDIELLRRRLMTGTREFPFPKGGYMR